MNKRKKKIVTSRGHQMCYCHSPTWDAISFMEELASCVNARFGTSPQIFKLRQKYLKLD
ncbi:hypothetical protein CAJAP_07740 [Camponotus japonicus]